MVCFLSFGIGRDKLLHVIVKSITLFILPSFFVTLSKIKKNINADLETKKLYQCRFARQLIVPKVYHG